MIISASRRTDIPAWGMDGFLESLERGYIDVMNPMNARQVSRVSLAPADVDGIVFWTKDARPLLAALPRLAGVPFYVQATLTPYGANIEPGAPDKTTYPDTLRRIADARGPDAIVWRYDPILMDANWTVQAHLEAFARFARQLHGVTNLCVISFLDVYQGIAARMRQMGIRTPDEREKEALAAGIAGLAGQHGMGIATCAEEVNLSKYGIEHAKCIDAVRMGRVCGHPILAKMAVGQRARCGCDHSRDIGAYGTCTMGCAYCYAK